MRYCPDVPHKKQQRTAIGVAIRLARKTADLTQEDLADKAGVGRTALARIESGAQPNPELATLKALAGALGTTVKALVGEEDTATQTSGKALADMLRNSPLAAEVTEDEYRWLESVPSSMWMNVEPTPATLYHLLLAYRAAKAKKPESKPTT